MKISKEVARRFLLAHHHLLPARELEGKTDILAYIEKVSCIQYDPLDVVGYNPYLVLQSRVKGFKPWQLQELLYQDRLLLDGWDKNMAIYLVRDWPYFERYRKEAKELYGNMLGDVSLALLVVQEQLEKGPLSSLDLKLDEKINWYWAPTKTTRAILESMFLWGEIGIHHKEGTRKIYDLAERCIPKEILYAKDPNDTDEEYYAWYVKRRIGGVGLLWNRRSDAFLGISGMKSKERQAAFQLLEERDEILSVFVEGIKEPLYLRKEDEALLYEVREEEKKVSFLAPLDNLLWDRKLIKELFGFEYIWEVYKPKEERKYGYYVLPVLYGDRFVARFEPSFDKKNRVLRILNWWWEPGVVVTREMKETIKEALDDFLVYLEGDDIDWIRPCNL